MTEFQKIMQVCWPLIACLALFAGLVWGVAIGREQAREENQQSKVGEVERG